VIGGPPRAIRAGEAAVTANLLMVIILYPLPLKGACQTTERPRTYVPIHPPRKAILLLGFSERAYHRDGRNGGRSVIESQAKSWPVTPVVAFIESSPPDAARAAEQLVRAERNTTWFEAHAADIYRTHRDRFICVAGQELFVAETPEAVLAAAQTKHPDDDGRIIRYIPAEKLVRI
jgi:hypothetical protein